MVEFLNIRVEGEYIYADEHDMVADTWSKIKLHVTKEEYQYTGQMTGEMVKALWILQWKAEKRELMTREVVCWG